MDSNKEFVWTDELVMDFLNFTFMKAPLFQGGRADMEQFKASKQSKPILTTEDGVDKYEGGAMYWVGRKTLNMGHVGYIFNDSIKKSHLYNYVYFSSEEAAKDFILMNKPCLSVNDVLSCTKDYYTSPQYINDLKQIAKSKIDKK